MDIVGSDSPLLRLPASIRPEWSVFLEAFRHTIDVWELAYAQLTRICGSFAASLPTTTDSGVTTTGLPREVFVAATATAWMCIDAGHRLRSLLQNALPRLPGVNRSKSAADSIAVLPFLKRSTSITELRDAVQHLDERLAALAVTGGSVWGALAWMAVVDSDRIRVCLMVPGVVRTHFHLLPTLDGPVRAPVDHVVLRAHADQTHPLGYEVDLSARTRDIVDLVRELEAQLRPQFERLPRAGADLVLTLDLRTPTQDAPAPVASRPEPPPPAFVDASRLPVKSKAPRRRGRRS